MSLYDLGKTVSKFAPLLGSVIGGPAGGAIGTLVAAAFGGDINNPEDLIRRIQNDPDARVKLAEIESNERIELQKLAVDQVRAENEGRANAYNREIEISKIPLDQRDKITSSIAIIFIVGYFFLSTLVLIAIWFGSVSKDELEPIIQMQKDMGLAIMLILAYFFGASIRRNN